MLWGSIQSLFSLELPDPCFLSVTITAFEDVDTMLEVEIAEDNMKPYKNKSPPHEVKSIILNASLELGKYFFLDECRNRANYHLTSYNKT